MQILDGKLLSEKFLEELRGKVLDFKKKEGFVPGLAVILVGEDPASKVYVRNKIKACEKLHFYSKQVNLPQSISQENLKKEIQSLNKDKDIHGILLQLPLPSHLNSEDLIEEIDEKKDVDALTLKNQALLLSGKSLIQPCTPQGVLFLLKSFQIPLKGKKALVVGRSPIVGLPLFHMLLKENATVTLAHSHTKNLKELSLSSDLIFVCAGKAHLLEKEDFKKGAVVIDVGIHKVDGKLLGDVKGSSLGKDREDLKSHLKALSPVPGGIGPLTIAMLMKNCFELAKNSNP